MTRFKVGVIAVTVLAVTGCREAESVTGGYGERVLAGQVAMAAGMSNSSPEGVRVFVRTTGMSAVLDTTGNFMFMNVPENAELRFMRADGIDARLRTAGMPGPLSIVLSSGSVGAARRRAAIPAPLKQYEGLVQTISASQIRIGRTILKITADTLVRKGDQKLDAADVRAGDRVHVKANGDTAAEIIADTQPHEVSVHT